MVVPHVLLVLTRARGGACGDGKLRVITPGDGVVVHSGSEPMAVNPFWLHCGPDLRRSYWVLSFRRFYRLVLPSESATAVATPRDVLQDLLARLSRYGDERAAGLTRFLSTGVCRTLMSGMSTLDRII